MDGYTIKAQRELWCQAHSIMVTQCGVCHTQDSKYKCPVCALRYCSLECYKQHQIQHPASKSQQDIVVPTVKYDRPGTTQRTPKVDFTGFEQDAELQRLLTRYPLLKIQLQVIYGLTLEPGPEDARTWNRSPLFGEHLNTQRGWNRGRGRGRAVRGRRDGEIRYAGWENERPRGPWTREKGEGEAMGLIGKMRAGPREDESAEGMREFIELCKMKFAPSEMANEEPQLN